MIEAGNASLQTGLFGTALKASEYATEGVPLISEREIREGFFDVTRETPLVNAATIVRLPKFVLREGDIVFGRRRFKSFAPKWVRPHYQLSRSRN